MRASVACSILGAMGDKTIRNWEKDLRGLTVEGVKDRVSMARRFEAAAMAPGTGRNQKAARMWREKLRQAEAELERRNAETQRRTAADPGDYVADLTRTSDLAGQELLGRSPTEWVSRARSHGKAARSVIVPVTAKARE